MVQRERVKKINFWKKEDNLQLFESDVNEMTRFLIDNYGESKVLTEPVRPAESLLRDFEYCKEVGDYQTIKNRITNGLHWGWIKELK